MPAYMAEATIEKAFLEIPAGAVGRVLVVDDASRDSTVKIAGKLGLETVVHPRNLGYGGSQKTGYATALENGAEIVVMLHADAQYDARKIPDMVEPIRSGAADMVLGSRMSVPGGARRGGMPVSKIIVNRALTAFQNSIFGTSLTDMHTGYRAYSRECLLKLPVSGNSDGFIFDSEIIAQAAFQKMRIAEIPIESRYFNEASSIGFFHGAVYTFKTILIALKFLMQKSGLFRFRLFDCTGDKKC